MHGVTREIELDGHLDRPGPDERGKRRIALRLSGELNRRDFGLTWNQAVETGGALLGNKVKIAIELSAVNSDSS